MTSNPFRKAVKSQLKARVALDGPTGSGKTWTALEWATVLADGGTIALVDTEHESASLYANRFAFDTCPWEPPYDPRKLADTIRVAQANGYAVIIIDSLTHFWQGEGGTLDIVDTAAEKARGNTYAGWKVGTPALRHLIDTILACDMHVIATMRSKMEYVLEEKNGKQVPKKVGMAPIMRDGVEYEFTVVGDLDLDHRLVFSKSRCDVLADTMAQPGRAGEAAETFLKWLNDGEPVAPADVVADIKSRLNGLDGEARRQFRAHVGHPDRLMAVDVERALATVAQFERGAGDPVLALAEDDEGSASLSPEAVLGEPAA